MRWVTIPQAPNYIVSDCGLVKSLPVAGKTKGKVLKPYIGSNGYPTYCLRRDNKNVKMTLHRLLAEAFIDNPFSLPCVNHIDGNKQNNNLNNLEWVTYQLNNLHALDTGLRVMPRGESFILTKVTVSIRRALLAEYIPRVVTQKMLALKYNLSKQTVYNVIRESKNG